MHPFIRMHGYDVAAHGDDRLSALAVATRSRLLLLLEQRELSVSELCAVVQLPQSTESRHLKVLADESWVASRADGPSRHYRLAPTLDAEARALWETVCSSLALTVPAAADAERLPGVLAARASRSKEFFSTTAGRWDGVRSELFGASADLALLGLLDDRWTVGDLGCGTGLIASAMAPYVDWWWPSTRPPRCWPQPGQRLGSAPNVDLRAGRLEELPVASGELDAAVLFLVLHYVTDPAAALAEAGRALRPGARCWSSTWPRTTGSTTASRWATSGSALIATS